MDFTIDECYIQTISVYNEGSLYGNRTDLTDEELIKVLQGKAKWSSFGSADHPEYAKLRNQLEELGFIKTERGWWNGDYVLKPFTLNGVKFKKDEQFSSSAAMKFHLEYSRKHGR